MSRPVCVVTGATRGIGLAAAQELARRGYDLVLVGRTESRLQQVVHQLKQRTPDVIVRPMLADLSRVTETARLAREIRGFCPRIAVLLNNAGAIIDQRLETREGIEQTFALNHMAYFTLTHGLLDVLRASPGARVINVASDLHRKGELHFDDLGLTQGYTALKAYNQSKLANVMFTFELARRLQGSGVTSNCLHPGVVATGFGHNTRGLIKWYVTLARPFLLTPEKAAQTAVYLATDPELAQVTGKYFKNCREEAASPRAYDADAARRLWELSENLMNRAAVRQGGAATAGILRGVLEGAAS